MLADTITPETPIQIGMVVAAVGSFMGGALWIQRSMTRFQHALELFKLEVQQRLASLEDKSGGKLTRAEFRAWIHELRASNPNLKIPDFDGEWKSKD